MAYIVLVAAILSEVIGTISLRFVDGLSRPLPLVLVVLGYGSAFVALANVLKMGIPVGVAYAIWSAAGVALVVLIGALFLNETMTLTQIAGILLIIGGVVALEAGGAH
ncbi:small multidrug resistance pump [Actinopolyspora lacussalsi]|uniref:Small multidrug resistance pump n=2 Tax=Actinopolyspora alba group TaxID=2893675 RepID=A0A1I2C093_9ACTN|nr:MULTISPECIES: multidrug efflux SMR transporter [Actinopolyspora alba group]MDP9643159.1 small multidrug resistance pump [Actinopolyspora lacussalsi]SFE61602.1 small multidrug resistance pump [Actinopolyspora alba]SFT92433.1 small multidrug resistance pump [Actinopolyspora righensis]